MRLYGEYVEDHFRKGRDRDLRLRGLGRLLYWEKGGDAVLCIVEGVRTRFTQKECDGELRPCQEADASEPFTVAVRIAVRGTRTFRITACVGDQVPEHRTVMLEDGDGPGADWSLREEPGCLRIETAEAALCVDTGRWRLRMEDAAGRTVFLQNVDDRVLDFAFESLPFGFAENPATGESIACESIAMDADEWFYGLGEQFTPVNKKLQEVDVWITDPLSVGSGRTYLSVPFFMSTRGYGLFVNTHGRSKYFLGNRSNRSCSFHVSEDVLDYYLFCGPSFRDILGAYTGVTGRSPMPPKWSFGLWMSRCSYRSRDEVEEVARALRDHDIPCDVLNIDTDWFARNWACDWKFSREKFPEPAAMIRGLEARGFKLCLWQKPYITVDALPELSAELGSKGWLALGRDGGLSRRHPVFDVSDPEARRWYQGLLEELFRLGVRAIKTDMGEGAAPEGVYRGFRGEEMHNIYPYLYNKAAFEATRRHYGEAVVWGRSGYAGSQKYPVTWGGDPTSDFEGLRFSLRGGLSLGMSGFTFWSHDIGGFLGRPDPVLYVRWAQAGLFASHSRAHGAENPREPWTFGAEAEAIFRKYDKLRYRLLPYIYSTAYASSRRGLPVMRHLALEYQEDPAVHHVDDEYLFGDAFLVAPVLSPEPRRRIYLPEGEWVDFHEEIPYKGGRWIDFPAPLSKLPLFVKAGSIVPMGVERDFIDGSEEKDVSLEVYAVREGGTRFEFYDGYVAEIRSRMDASGCLLEWSGMRCGLSVNLHGFPAVRSMARDGEDVPYERQGGTCHVGNLPPSASLRIRTA